MQSTVAIAVGVVSDGRHMRFRALCVLALFPALAPASWGARPALGATAGILLQALPSIACSIPTSAQAYSLNMTVVPLSQLTYLTTWPNGQSIPTVSTLNDFSLGTVVPGRVVANAAIVPAGTSGSVNFYVSDATDVIMDINGYFAP
jgi:hypothetical protein